ILLSYKNIRRFLTLGLLLSANPFMPNPVGTGYLLEDLGDSGKTKTFPYKPKQHSFFRPTRLRKILS
ncbi:MAG: hypothetical protein ACXWV2_09500, partial [Chitinophagaceae bacterium]